MNKTSITSLIGIYFILLVHLSPFRRSNMSKAFLLKACTAQEFQKIKSDICAMIRRDKSYQLDQYGLEAQFKKKSK